MNAELTAAAIKYLEPVLRARGQALDFTRLQACMDAGYLSDLLTATDQQITDAVAKYDTYGN